MIECTDQAMNLMCAFEEAANAMTMLWVHKPEVSGGRRLVQPTQRLDRDTEGANLCDR